MGNSIMKFAILGCGHIATKMAKAVKALETRNMGVECYAVASRTLDKAKKFADDYGFGRAYGSYEELANDPQVDLIYVATPHSEHYQNALLCLNAGRKRVHIASHRKTPFSSASATTSDAIRAFAVKAFSTRRFLPFSRQSKMLL